MSDNKKKYLFDKEKNRMSLKENYPSKYSVALEELDQCLGCLDSVGRCAFDVQINATDTQLNDTLALINNGIKQLNAQFDQIQQEELELKRLKERIEMVSNPFTKGLKIGYLVTLGLGAVVSYILSNSF